MAKTIESISSKLKGLRAEKGYSLEDMANKLEIHRETFRKYENNPATLEIGQLLKILDIYNIDTVSFFELIYGKMPNCKKYKKIEG